MARIHQAKDSTLWQLCNDASNTVLIKSNGVAWKWVATPFSTDSIVFNEKNIASVVIELSQHWLWRMVFTLGSDKDQRIDSLSLRTNENGWWPHIDVKRQRGRSVDRLDPNWCSCCIFQKKQKKILMEMNNSNLLMDLKFPTAWKW